MFVQHYKTLIAQCAASAPKFINSHLVSSQRHDILGSMNKTIKLDECWLWAGSLNEKDYGVVYYYVNGKNRRQAAHRVLYEQYNGWIPRGLVIDHLCRVHRCVNPDHLEAVTIEVNIMRGIGPTARNARKTHCPENHELTPDNIITRYHGSNGRPNRHCKTCHRNYQREYMRKRYVRVADRV